MLNWESRGPRRGELSGWCSELFRINRSTPFLTYRSRYWKHRTPIFKEEELSASWAWVGGKDKTSVDGRGKSQPLRLLSGEGRQALDEQLFVQHLGDLI